MTGDGTVALITGGAGGMGLATAKIVGREHRVLLADLSEERLTAAVATLAAAGIDAHSTVCDVADRQSVTALVRTATSLGTVMAAVHTAGVSPQMADAERIVRINALGTVNVTTALLDVAADGFRLVNVASMAAHMLPRALVPRRAFRHAAAHPAAFMSKVMRRVNLAPKGQRSAMAYPVSKQFVVWYTKQMAAAYGAKGAGIVSVSPGSIDTEMGRLEEAHGAGAMLEFAALKRFGRVAEIAELLAFCASDKASYLTGVDVLCDGGVIAGITWKDLLTVTR